MNGKMIGTKPLYVALAQRKDVRRQALESQMSQRANQRMAYQGAGAMGPGYMGQPVYGYPPMPGYGQPGMMPMRGAPMMGYPGQPQMMQNRPRYAGPNGQQGVPYGMPGMPGMPPAGPYGAPQNFARGPGARPPQAGPGRVNGGPSPVGVPQGLPANGPRGAQMPVRPQFAGEQAPVQAPRLSAQSLARAPPQEQKQMLGEALYPLIHE
jgi:polyadenylate-binding protein